MKRTRVNRLVSPSVNTYTTCPGHKHVIHNRSVLGWQGRVSKTKIASHLLSYAACAVEGLTQRFLGEGAEGASRGAGRGGAGRSQGAHVDSEPADVCPELADQRPHGHFLLIGVLIL